MRAQARLMRQTARGFGRLGRVLWHALCLSVAFSLGFGAVEVPVTMAFYTASATNAGNTFITATEFAPTLNTATVGAGGTVTLAWTWPATGGEPTWNTGGYDVYRATSLNGTYTRIGSRIQGTSTYVDPTNDDGGISAPVNGVQYFYSVRAKSPNGGSAVVSNKLSVTIDSAAPTLLSVSPADTTTGVPTNGRVNLVFSEAMNQTSVWNTVTPANSAFCLFPTAGTCLADRVAGTGTWNAAGTQLTFAPTATLTASTGYTLSVTTAATDLAGNALAASTTTFTTAAGTDTANPYATAHTPTGSTVGQESTVVVTFNEAMDRPSTEAAFCLYKSACGTDPVVGSFTWNGAGTQLTFTPSGLLAGSQAYTARIRAGTTPPATDMAGNALCNTEGSTCAPPGGSDYTFSFTTASGLVPTVNWVSPANGATAIGTDTSVVAAFSLAMATASLWTTGAASDAFCVYPDLAAAGTCAADRVAGTVTWNSPSDTYLTFVPTTALTASALYRVTIAGTATSSGGVAISAPWASSFTTGTGPSGVTLGTATPTPSTLYPGSSFTLGGTGWSNNLTGIEVRWDDGSSLGTGSTDGTGVLSTTALVLPITATAGAHDLVLVDPASGARKVVSVTVTFPSSLTLLGFENGVASDGKLTPGQANVTVQATVKDGGSAAIQNAGVRLNLTSVPGSCAGATLTPASGTVQQTNASGQATWTLAPCTQDFNSVVVKGTAGDASASSPSAALNKTLTFLDPPPDPPTGLTGTQGSIHLTWQNPANDRATGYYLYVGTKSGTYDQRIDVAKSTSYVFEDGSLAPGVTYYFALEAYDARGRLSEKTSNEAVIAMPYPIGAIKLSATPSRVKPGESTLIEATVLDSQGKPRIGQVTFSLPQDRTGSAVSTAEVAAEARSGRAATALKVPIQLQPAPGEATVVRVRAQTPDGSTAELDVLVDFPVLTLTPTMTPTATTTACATGGTPVASPTPCAAATTTATAVTTGTPTSIVTATTTVATTVTAVVGASPTVSGTAATGTPSPVASLATTPGTTATAVGSVTPGTTLTPGTPAAAPTASPGAGTATPAGSPGTGINLVGGGTTPGGGNQGGGGGTGSSGTATPTSETLATATALPSPTATATRVPTAEREPSVTVPPTATAPATAAATATAVPPTATGVPPTATAVPATNTPAPPAATPTPLPVPPTTPPAPTSAPVSAPPTSAGTSAGTTSGASPSGSTTSAPSSSTASGGTTSTAAGSTASQGVSTTSNGASGAGATTQSSSATTTSVTAPTASSPAPAPAPEAPRPPLVPPQPLAPPSPPTGTRLPDIATP